MLDSKIQEELKTQLEAARALLTSPEWGLWVKFLRTTRRGFLQKKVNEAVEKGDIVEAQICRALMDDCEKQIQLFGGFVRNLETESKKGAE